MRAVIDTNVWVSAVINAAGAPARVLAALRAHSFELISSEPLLEELAVVLARPRLALRFHVTPDALADLLAVLRDEASIADVTGTVRICRDPKDDVVIETAINGRADVLVSRDDDLTRAPEVAAILVEHGIRVLTIQRFLDALGNETTASP
jgi:putative PIN family toxin of toxin-antitoxin system